MHRFFWYLIFILIVLHQDVFLWESTYLVGGIIPAGLAYHIGISLAATLLWLAVVLFSWPKELEEDGEATH